MSAQVLVVYIKKFLRPTVLLAFLSFAFFVTLSGGAASLQAADDRSLGTVPPLTRFAYTVAPNLVQVGQTITYEVIIVNSDATYVNVDLGFTGTMPSGVTVIPSTLVANIGAGGIDASGQVTWTGKITETKTILISYQAIVNANQCGNKVSQARLYEVNNIGAGGPTPEQLVRPAEFAVEGNCPLYLPNLSRAPLSAIPRLLNWNFEQGPNAPGWGQFDNNRPSVLIYSVDQKQLNPPPPDGKWFGWLGGLFNNSGELRQTIVLPTDHRQIELRFRYMIGSVDSCDGKDKGYVLIDGKQVGPTYELCKANADVWRQAQIMMPPTSEKPVELVLRAVTDATKNSNWFVDDVVFCSTDARAAAADRCN